MLTRLKVTGFKNLVDVDVRFGPFTCIAGVNGVGKSNLFDAIQFLSALADRSLHEAALSLRDEGGRTADVRNLFHRVGDTYEKEMSFEAEMIIPHEGFDDLGRKAEASITFLRYALILGLRKNDNARSPGPLELKKEELVHIKMGEASKHILFSNKRIWRSSVVKGRRTTPFISTEDDSKKLIIKRHQEGRGGRTQTFLAASLPRTVLSVSSAAESPTALLVRREMQSWRLLQLEPSSLRKPDEFSSPERLGADGAHLPATLNRLVRRHGAIEVTGNPDEMGDHEDPGESREKPIQSNHDESDARCAEHVYGQVAIRLAELVDDVHKVWIDPDQKREIYTLKVADRDGTEFPAQSLSDGTLRFLALAVLELDPESQGLVCLEEPENGIHPERIPAMLRLLRDIASDVNEPLEHDNPLRQVIVNTHSPAVVCQVPDDSLVIAVLKEKRKDRQRFRSICLSCLPGTWRSEDPEAVNVVSRGNMLAYLNPVEKKKKKGNRVVDRSDLQLMLPFNGKEE